MKRILLTTAMLLLTTILHATPNGMVDYGNVQRVMHFNADRNAISDNGTILVCLPYSKATNPGCVNANGTNAWLDIASINIPEHYLIGFEYRMVGSGYRHLFLYFRKKR